MKIKGITSATCCCGEEKINHQFSVGPRRWFCYCSACGKRGHGIKPTAATKRWAVTIWNRTIKSIKPMHKVISVWGNIW